MSEVRKILFLCNANKDRSILAEEYFSTHPLYHHHSYSSAGLNEVDVLSAQRKLLKDYPSEDHIPVYATVDMLRDSDEIYVMEDKHKDWVHNHFNDNFPNELDDILGKIVVLDIKDVFSRYDERDKMFCNLIDEKLGSILCKM